MDQLHSCKGKKCGFAFTSCILSCNIQRKSLCRVTCPACRWDMSLKDYLRYHLHTVHGVNTTTKCPFCWGTDVGFPHLFECFVKTFPHLFVGKVRPVIQYVPRCEQDPEHPSSVKPLVKSPVQRHQSPVQRHQSPVQRHQSPVQRKPVQRHGQRNRVDGLQKPVKRPTLMKRNHKPIKCHRSTVSGHQKPGKRLTSVVGNSSCYRPVRIK